MSKGKTTTPQPYKESDDHVPNPMWQTGNVDTTGTSGGASSIHDVSPLFQQARADALSHAADVLDEEGDEEDDGTVITPGEDAEPTAEDLREAAELAQQEADSNLTPGQRGAAESGDDSVKGVGGVNAPGTPTATESSAPAPAKKAPAKKAPAKKAPAKKK